MRKKEWEKRIELPDHGNKAKLARDCLVNPRTVYEALRGKRDTDNTRLIRKKALEVYGGFYVKDKD